MACGLAHWVSSDAISSSPFFDKQDHPGNHFGRPGIPPNSSPRPFYKRRRRRRAVDDAFGCRGSFCCEMYLRSEDRREMRNAVAEMVQTSGRRLRSVRPARICAFLRLHVPVRALGACQSENSTYTEPPLRVSVITDTAPDVHGSKGT